MCQLLGMNCNVPTDICFSFEGFARRGGETDEHKDGWGISFFEGRGCRTFMDVQPSASSVISDLVTGYPIKSLNVIAHIRKASVGAVSLENTHPFTRELWGQNWVFAHNGDLLDFHPRLNGRFLPVGSTDSEQAFCLLLERMHSDFTRRPDPERLYRLIRKTAASISSHGSFNFLLSNGEYLLAHCSSDLHYLIRKHPFSNAQLKDLDMTIDFRQVTGQDDRVAVIATQPLTVNEEWIRIKPGECLLFRDGDLMARTG
jgi:predicted glutamine amidotransferase